MKTYLERKLERQRAQYAHARIEASGSNSGGTMSRFGNHVTRQSAAVAVHTHKVKRKIAMPKMPWEARDGED